MNLIFGKNISKEKMNEKTTNFLLPPFVTIELSNTCNFNCPMCTLSEKDPLKPSFIDMDLFNKIVDDIYSSELVFSDLRLFWAGEPMLHPRFSELIEILAEHELKNHKFNMVSLDTNASNLSGDNLRSIQKYADTLKIALIISLDAASEESYSKMRRGGDYEKTIKNIKALLDNIRSDHYPTVAVQFIICDENKHELGRFLDFWRAEFENRGLVFNILLNSSTAEKNGVNIRPLTEQNYPDLQEKANELYIDTLFKNGIIRNKKNMHIVSQGGGRYEEK